MRVRTKVNIVIWSVTIIFVSLLIDSILRMANGGFFIEPDMNFKMFIAAFMGLVGIVVFFWEFKVPIEKNSIAGEPKDVKTYFDYPARVMIFKLKDIVIAFGAPTPLFEPPNISNDEIEVYGEIKSVDKLPDLIFWNAKNHLKSLTNEIFFATRIKKLNTSEEYEAPLLVPALQVILWILIIAIPFFLQPHQTIIRTLVYGMLGLVLAIILPNWIFEKIKQKRM